MAYAIYLNTRGAQDGEPEELRALLRYMEHSTAENAVNETLEELHKMVEEVRRGKETPEEMKWFEELQMEREEGIEEGIEKGIERERQNTERERLRAESAEALLRQHGIKVSAGSMS